MKKSLILLSLIATSAAYADIVIPPGMTFDATVDAGVALSHASDAGDPTPMTLNITEGSLKSCTVIADAFPDFASNRAKVRINKFVCNGKEINVKAYAVDKDGKAGLRNTSSAKDVISINSGTFAHIVILEQAKL